jgi:glycosyltransferase involved in cell wall biosynthesis
MIRVCLVADSEPVDEGLRIVGRCLGVELDDANLTLKTVNIRALLFWNEIRRFRPDVIHFVLSPSLIGLAIAKLVALMNTSAKTIVSAIHPDPIDRRLLRLFRQDLVLVQARESEETFSSAGWRTEFLPNGVDTTKFCPVHPEEKKKLRERFAIPKNKFILLHLASLKKERNLKVFARLQGVGNNQVIIVGREHEKVDESTLSLLRESGCTVWIKHFPNIEEIYNLADCYVFPVAHRGFCIETPLSVLEAMSCDIPTITTRFGALPRLFKDTQDVFFADNDDEIDQAIETVKKGGARMRPREAVLHYTWKQVTERLLRIYERLLGESPGTLKSRSH